MIHRICIKFLEFEYGKSFLCFQTVSQKNVFQDFRKILLAFLLVQTSSFPIVIPLVMSFVSKLFLQAIHFFYYNRVADLFQEVLIGPQGVARWVL